MQNISDLELNYKLKRLVQFEKKLLRKVLLHIAEVDSRKLYLSLGFPSLFEYLTKEIGYENGPAQRRIDGARLLNKIPEIGIKIEKGSVTLSQLSQVGQALRQIKKTKGETLNYNEQKNLISEIENKTIHQTEVFLAQKFDLPVEYSVKTKHQKDESVRLEITLTKEQMDILEKARALLSNTLKSGSLTEVIVHLAANHVKEKEKREKDIRGVKVTTAAVVRSRYIPAQVKRTVWRRDHGRCQYKDPLSKRQCNSSHFIHYDHVIPFAYGGPHSADNLRLLCSAHNLIRSENKKPIRY